MARLIANSAFGESVSSQIGDLRLEEVSLGPATLVAPFRGREAAVAAALPGGFPAPGQALSGPGAARAIWMGPGRALVCGVAVAGLDGLAALVDQSDGTAGLHLSGAPVVDVLARLVPIDLRLAAFPPGHTARTLVNHIPASVTRVGPQEIEILAPRSMAMTLLHEVTEAAQHVAARAATAG